MSKSIRQQIVEAVGARLQTITVNSGYQTDIGARATIWNVTPITSRELQGVDVRDITESHVDKITRHTDHTLRIDAEVHAQRGTGTAAYVRNAIADITRAIGTDTHWTVDGIPLALSTKILKDEMIVDKTDKIVGGAQVQIEIEYRTARFNPFSQTIS